MIVRTLLVAAFMPASGSGTGVLVTTAPSGYVAVVSPEGLVIEASFVPSGRVVRRTAAPAFGFVGSAALTVPVWYVVSSEVDASTFDVNDTAHASVAGFAPVRASQSDSDAVCFVRVSRPPAGFESLLRRPSGSHR